MGFCPLAFCIGAPSRSDGITFIFGKETPHKTQMVVKRYADVRPSPRGFIVSKISKPRKAFRKIGKHPPSSNVSCCAIATLASDALHRAVKEVGQDLLSEGVALMGMERSFPPGNV